MAKLKLHPDKSGYSVKLQNGETLEVALDGGLPRARADVLNPAKMVTVQWITHKDGYDYLCAFHRKETKDGSLPFTIDLILDTPNFLEYTAQFQADTLSLDSQSGATYYVKANLYVTPIYDANQNTIDAGIITTFEANYPYQV